MVAVTALKPDVSAFPDASFWVTVIVPRSAVVLRVASAVSPAAYVVSLADVPAESPVFTWAVDFAAL